MKLAFIGLAGLGFIGAACALDTDTAVEPISIHQNAKIYYDEQSIKKLSDSLPDVDVQGLIAKTLMAPPEAVEPIVGETEEKEEERSGLLAREWLGDNDEDDDTVSQAIFPWKQKEDDCDNGADDEEQDSWPHKIIYVKFGYQDAEPQYVREKSLPPRDDIVQQGSIKEWLESFLDDCEKEQQKDCDEEEDFFDYVREQEGRVIFVAFTDEEKEDVIDRLALQVQEIVNEPPVIPNVVVISVEKDAENDSSVQAASHPEDFHAAFSLREAVEKLKRGSNESDPCDVDWENDVTYFDDQVDCERFIYVSWGDVAKGPEPDEMVVRQLRHQRGGIRSKTNLSLHGFTQFNNTVVEESQYENSAVLAGFPPFPSLIFLVSVGMLLLA